MVLPSASVRRALPHTRIFTPTRAYATFRQEKHRKENPVRAFGWTMALVLGGCATYLVVTSIPSLGRYIKLSTM